MSRKDDLVRENTAEDLADLVLALESDAKALKGEVTEAKIKLLESQKQCAEMKRTLSAGASQLHKYKDLEKTVEDLEKQNSTLSKKVVELEDLNGTMEASIPLQQDEIKQLNIRNKDLIVKNAGLQEALSSTRETFKAESEECAKNKEEIRTKMQESVTSLRERIDALNKEELDKETIITDMSNKCTRLEGQILALKQVETEQRRSIMNANERHQQDQKQLKLFRDTMAEELRLSKAECKALRERLESTQGRLNDMAKTLGKDRPKSPVGRVSEKEKGSTDGKSFLVIGNRKGDGRKSPLGGGASLDPQALARKIKYRF